MDMDDDQRKKMENWPIFGALSEVIIGAAPKQKRINIYLAAGEKKAMFQVTEEQAEYLIRRLSNAQEDLSRGAQ